MAAAAVASANALYFNATSFAPAAAAVSSLLRIFVASWRNATAGGALPDKDANDFFSCRMIAEAASVLMSAPGARTGWTPGDITDLAAAAAPVCAPQMRGTWNQATVRSSGAILFAQTFPEHDAGGALVAYAREVWADWQAQHSYPENSNVYNALMFADLFDLGRALDAAAFAADMRSAGTRKMLDHYLALADSGPAGIMSSFGDSWPGAGGADPDGVAPWTHEELAYWPPVFEAAAAAYGGNAAYSAAAARYFSAFNLSDGLATANGDYVRASGFLRRLLQADAARAADPALYDTASLAAAPNVRGAGLGGAAVLNRTMPGPAGAAVDLPCKVVLAPAGAAAGGCANGSYALVEALSSSGLYHTHPQQVGSVAHYAAGGVDFLHGLGYVNRLPEFASGVALFPADGATARFPFRRAEDQFAPATGGAWRRAELPTFNMQPVSQRPADFFARNLSALHVYVNNAGGGADAALFLGRIELFRPDGNATLLIDDFAGGAGDAWPGGSVVADPTLPGGGGSVLALACPRGVVTNSTRPAAAARRLPGAISADEWPYLRFYWRFAAGGGADVTTADLLVIGTGPYTIPEGDYAGAPLRGQYDWNGNGVGPGTQFPRQAPAAAEALSPNSWPRVTAVRAENGPDGDAFGAVSLERVTRAGIAWTRVLVLLAEGPLLAVDTLDVAPAALEAGAGPGWVAGPSWALQVAQDPTPGPDPGPGGGLPWLDAAGFNGTGCLLQGTGRSADARLLLAFAAWGGGGGFDLVVGAQRQALAGGVDELAAFARSATPLAAGRTVFASLLLPHSAAAAPPAALALRINATRADDGTVTVGLPLARVGDSGAPSASAIVEIGADAATWRVVRQG